MTNLLQKAAGLITNRKHRGNVGGIWDAIGKLQFDHLVGRVLEPDMYLLDVGCGCLRGGIHFIRYLAPAHYYGIDINRRLLDIGYKREL